ncbi:guanine permease [Edaphobacillus lindanitolerans]|uniref:Putative MFS transporter, AGZA family, xanthine/uracil permease n=1 Tax=Edaphobacillus lindanitolerans TaxID=550447 RepID=A0A1U7PMZ4_9BACI|nr:guanine permease [Edaphobacillus lindanitolerans]SIT71622.1 putative MFS transporter, AGZA family, xanthine/uracil permease [Edaphobacillus lindanitolerans]
MDIWKDVLAALSGVLNALPQGLLALTFGFASIPTALAFIVGAAGNAATSNVAVISYQAETITLAGTMGRNMRERLSMIFFGAAILTVIGLFGVLEGIIDWIGPIVTSGMMAGVGIMLSKVAWDMARADRLIGIVSMASALLTYIATSDLVYTITVSVILSSVAYAFAKKSGTQSQPIPSMKEGFIRQKLIVNPSVIRGALALVCLNIGANIAFGKINGEIAGAHVNVDTITVISSLADMASSFFGGAPVEIVISATASAPHAVLSGILMMILMAIILVTGLLPKIGRFVPSASIAGFLFVLGAFVTLPGNAIASLTGEGAGSGITGAVTMMVTALTDPFFGMLAGVVTDFLLGLFGAV